jgi:hypothetical protein
MQGGGRRASFFGSISTEKKKQEKGINKIGINKLECVTLICIPGKTTEI